jgi:GNAT superfamily N-acetyltransferase
MIREAAVSDIPEIARLGGKFHAQAGWSEIAYSADDCAASLAAFMEAGCFLCIVAEVDGDILGMAAGVVSPVYFNRDHLSGEELFWWVDADAPQLTGLRLLDALEMVARERGCQTWQMKSLARLNGERMKRLYERRGYRASEQTFIKRL